jgi:hypothetical protein
MSPSSVVRAVVAFAAAVGGVAVAVSQMGFGVVGGAIGVRVGSPGAGVEVARALFPILVAVLVAAVAIRFGVRALRSGATFRADLSRGGKLVAVTAWVAWAWLAFWLWYRQQYLGWATLYGDLTRSLVGSAVLVAVALALDRVIPWERAPRGVRHFGLLVVAAVSVLAAASAWFHRDVVTRLALAPVALVGLALLVSGVRRVEAGPRERSFVELGLASLLLAGPLWRLFS